MAGIRLSERLYRVASYVEQGSVPVDVGTDHAYVPIFLLQNGISPRVSATEIRSGPLETAVKNAEAWGVRDRLTLYLCDGLTLCGPEGIDCVILAGMGGETMRHILERSPWALEKRLILQPQTKLAELRRFLASNGLTVLDAALAEDAGRIYPVWLAGPGSMDPDAPVDAPLIENNDPLLRAYLQELIRRGEKKLRGIEASDRREGLEEASEELNKIKILFNYIS